MPKNPNKSGGPAKTRGATKNKPKKKGGKKKA